MLIKSQMSLILGQFEVKHPELFAIEFGKIAESDCLHSSIYKYLPINTKLGQNVCDHKIPDEFDYGSNQTRTSQNVYDHKSSDEFYNGTNRTRTVRVICPRIRKFSIFDLVYTLACANIDQSVPNLATVYMPIKSRMSSILGQIESEHLKLFVLEFGKIAESDFVYTLASTNIDQSTPNLVKMYMTVRLRIMDLIRPELYEISALEFENLPYLTLFTLYHLQILTNQYQTWPQYI